MASANQPGRRVRPAPPAPEICCIIAVRDGANYIAEAIASLRRQTLQPKEIVVVDDGSTDATVSLAKQAGEERLRIVSQPRLGTASARNRGLGETGSPLVAFLDHDDISPPNRLADLYACLVNDPDAAGAFGRWRNFWVSGLEAEARDPKNRELTEIQTRHHLGAALLRREVFDVVGRFDTTFRRRTESRWLLESRALAVPFAMTEALVLERRIHENNISRAASTEDLVNVLWSWHKKHRKKKTD